VSPTASAPAGFDVVLEQVEAAFEVHLRRMREMGDLVLETARTGPLIESRLQPIRGHAVEWLGTGSTACGYGFVAAPGVVDGRDRYLCWFQRSDRDVRRLQLNFDIDDVNVYDYLDMDWYTRTEETRHPVIHGPWVDYTGSDQYVLTMAVPVVNGSDFLGICGSDVVMTRLEVELIPILRRLAGEAFLVNSNRQVVVSNSPRWIPGDRLRTHPLEHREDFATVAPVVLGSGWALATARA
jgi:hypothetical protein